MSLTGDYTTDWRYQRQERYLKGIAFSRRPYERCAENDHDHCEFCGGKFTDEPAPGTLQEGYATADDYRWICARCFHIRMPC